MRLQDPTAACTPAAGRSSGSEAQQTWLTAAWGSLGQGMDAKQAAQRVATFRRELARAVHVAAAGPPASQVSTGSAVATRDGAATGGAVPTSAVAETRSGTPGSSAPVSAVGVAGAVSMRESLQIVTTDGARVSIRFSEQDLIAAGSDGSGDSLAALLSRGRIQISVQGPAPSAERRGCISR
jgi:hypothetical protein